MLVFSVHVGGKTEETGENPSERGESQQEIQPNYGRHRARIESAGPHCLAWVSGFSYSSLPSCRERLDTQVKIYVASERCPHCAISAPSFSPANYLELWFLEIQVCMFDWC